MREAEVATDGWKGFELLTPVEGKSVVKFPRLHSSAFPCCLRLKGVGEAPAEVTITRRGDTWYVEVLPPSERHQVSFEEDVEHHMELNPQLSRQQVIRMVQEFHPGPNQLEGAQTNG